MNSKLRYKLELMAATPRTQIKRLALGSLVSILAMLVLVLTSEFESQWLFYFLSLLIIAGVLYAIPGYIGIWVWRMKDVILGEDKI